LQENKQYIQFTGKYYYDPHRHPGSFCIPLLFLVKVPDDVKLNTDREFKWFTKEEINNFETTLDNKQMILESNT
jgi:hypothetical protein